MYVRLEAAASLLRHGDDRGFGFIEECLASEYAPHRLEAVIILGEIGTRQAGERLVAILDHPGERPEIRAGAAWALGEMRDESSLEALVSSFVSVDAEVRTEAARALAKLAEQHTDELLQQLPKVQPEKRPGVAWTISRAHQFTVERLLATLVDDDARRWAAYIVGAQDQHRYIAQIERLRSSDPEVYFAITVLWQIMSSWIYGLEEYG